ncbi:general odorant-binding protein 83a-like [Zootermopsis nevadensis]|uniref:Pheromone-binding protein-related protein 3 n=1 Tax=Zootermopsis nevadensis TaxID=136037 RepID=A0A067QL07_ZOONE|nr:general odorant-binding protein 83a-like [Zootermopsis nevadensis]KDR09910.1 Pheromone-binding protein-related protein 3 [Zootermopsis nevadensis]
MKTTERVLASAILLLLGVADLASGLTGRAFERAKEVDEKCRSENNVERAYFEKFIKARIDEIDPPDNYKCFVKCVMVELMALNDEGDFNVDEELQNVPPEIVEEGHRIVKTCHGTPGKDPCDKAYQVHKCYHKENPELYSLILHYWENASQ